MNDKLYSNLIVSGVCDINYTTEIRFNIILYLNNMFFFLHIISYIIFQGKICILCIARFVMYSLLNAYKQTQH